MKEVKKGSKWYAKRPGASCLIECEIIDITMSTIQIVELDKIRSHKPERYMKAGLLFVEEIEEQENGQ
jgi:hypothetical protein